MNAKEHAELTREVLGKSYLKVHVYMDRFFDAVANLGPYHRRETHHFEGALETADEMVKQYGGGYDEWLGYLRAALEHISQDMVKDGKQYPVPRRSDYPDEQEYLPRGKRWEGLQGDD